MSSKAQHGHASPSRFATTHWSIVLAARDPVQPHSREALSALCLTYWYPLYAFVRRRGHDAEEARDLTQAFFLRLLEKDYLRVVDRARGKFRSFLLAAFEHFLHNEYDRARAQKRGGGRKLLSLDFTVAEDRYAVEPAHSKTPDKLFERRWALTLLDCVLARLEQEWKDAGKQEVFERLRPCLLDEPQSLPYATLAEELNISPAAVKMAAHRLRKRYRALLREEIARTVENPEQVDDEIAGLFAALGS
jgi:RNA polymerase sigma-70 factor (ECF subfamily)